MTARYDTRTGSQIGPHESNGTCFEIKSVLRREQRRPSDSWTSNKKDASRRSSCIESRVATAAAGGARNAVASGTVNEVTVSGAVVEMFGQHCHELIVQLLDLFPMARGACWTWFAIELLYMDNQIKILIFLTWAIFVLKNNIRVLALFHSQRRLLCRKNTSPQKSSKKHQCRTSQRIFFFEKESGPTADADKPSWRRSQDH